MTGLKITYKIMGFKMVCTWHCWLASGLWNWLKCLALKKEFISVGSRHLDKSPEFGKCVNLKIDRGSLSSLCFYCNMQNITERRVMSWRINVWRKKKHDFIPKSNNPNNLSEMLPNELWRKTFMSWNVVLGCNILIYWEFIFLLKNPPQKIRGKYQTMSLP